MNKKGSAHPISRKSLESHLSKVDDYLTNLELSTGDIQNFWNLAKGIGTNNPNLMAREVQDTIDIVRNGFSLLYEMHGLLELKADEVNSGVTESDKRVFLNSYALFAAASYIEYKMDLLISDRDAVPFNSEGAEINLDTTKDVCVKTCLKKLYLLTRYAENNKMFSRGIDFPRSSINYFRFLKEKALAVKGAFKPDLVALVKDSQFKIEDEDFTISGFETSTAASSKLPKIEFARVTPGEVVGNVEAKRKVIRYMDKLALYDPKAGNNPAILLGGLSWTNLWDGIPGTGKTTMMRMAMTRLADLCEAIGIKYKIHPIDSSVKSEFYGKTGQNALLEFNSTRDPTMLHITILDDLDLLTSGTRNDSGGADNDLRNVIMQFLDGAFTLRIGNNQVYAASNDPKGLDSAIRNRFNDRILVEGPKTPEDISDMTVILARPLTEAGLFKVELGYTPFLTQDNYVNGKWTKPEEVVHSVDPEFSKRFKKATIRDFGQYLHELKKEYPSISGRSVKAIMEAVKDRSASFDVPQEFFTKREAYFNHPFERKIEILKELYMHVESEMLFQEAKRYAESEARYTQGERDREVERGYNSRVWGMMAEIQALEQHPELYAQRIVLAQRLEQNKEHLKEIERRIEAGAKK